MAVSGHFVKKKVAYLSEMARNAIKSEFRTSKMADRSKMARNAIESDFRTSRMAAEKKTRSLASAPALMSRDDLRAILREELSPFTNEVATKIDVAMEKLTTYVDTQVGQLVSRLEKVEEVQEKGHDQEVWLVVTLRQVYLSHHKNPLRS